MKGFFRSLKSTASRSLRVCFRWVHSVVSAVYSLLKVCWDWFNRRILHTNFLHHIKSEFVAAIFVASFVVIVGSFNLLEDLNQDVMQLVMSALSIKLPPNVDPSKADIAVVLLDDLEYEDRFNQVSPLNRAELYNIFNNVLRKMQANDGSQGLKLLVADFDFSPGPGKSTSSSQMLLDSLLQRIATEFDTKIVLIMPQPVFGYSLKKTKLHWIQSMCAAGIQFGSPEILARGGLVLNYSATGPSLINVAHEVSENGGDISDAFCGNTLKIKQALDLYGSSAERGSSLLVKGYQYFKYYVKKKLMFDKNYVDPEKPINFNFVSEVRAIDYRDVCAKQENCSQPLNSKTIFIGGHYGLTDMYDTPIGNLSGVLIHAGSYFSKNVPVDNVKKIVEYLLDIAIGFASGLVFYFLAEKYRHHRSIFTMALNLLLQPLFVLVLVFCSAYALIHHDLLLNSVPILFGMAVHAEIVRAGEPEVGEEDQVALSPVENRIKWAIYFFVVAWACLYIANKIYHGH